MQEELTVDVDEEKHGHIVTDKGTRAYDQDLALAKMEDSKYKEENEALMKRVAELKESLDETTEDAHKLLGVVEQLKSKLDEALVSNARLVYSNKTLSDASLNERQKLKIVEAIAQANSAEEAKTLHETLTATVGSQTNSGPQSLSESVNRKSNLSAIMPRRKEKVVVESMSLAERMKKLAGIN
jgi:Txe/YoeB family toxin of Txe-Axe toxin-antitoxin module